MASQQGDGGGMHQAALTVLLCGGIAGVATWASVFPLDVIKTRLQAQTIHRNDFQQGTNVRDPERQLLLQGRTLSSFQLAKEAYQTEGLKPFYRGLGVCSIRAFIVNAVQVCCFFGASIKGALAYSDSGQHMNGL